MPVPTWVPGQTLASSDLNVWGRPLCGYKIGTTSQTLNTIQDPDPDLQVTFTATGIWVVEMLLRYNGPAANTLVFTWATPAGATGEYGAEFLNSSNAVAMQRQPFTNGLSLGTNGTGSEAVMRLIGLISSGPGTLQFNWAQGSSSATATSIDASSYLTAWRAN